MNKTGERRYEAQLKVALESYYGRPMSRKTFDHWVAAVFPGAPTGYTNHVHVDVQQIIQAIERERMFMPPRRGSQRAEMRDYKAEPPGWWLKQTREGVESFRSTQQAILVLFEQSGPLDVHSQDDLIAEQLGRQARSDLSTVLYHHSSLLSGFDGLRIPVQSEVWVPLDISALDFGAFSGQARPYALFFLARESQRMADETGCEQTAAVDFLLSDVMPEIPWVWVSADDFGGIAVNVRIGSLAVKPTEVMRVYAQALEQWRTADSQLFLLAPKRRRRSRRRTLALLEFMGEYSPEGNRRRNWPSLRQRWNELWPDWEFPSDKAMYEAFRRAKRSRDHE